MKPQDPKKDKIIKVMMEKPQLHLKKTVGGKMKVRVSRQHKINTSANDTRGVKRRGQRMEKQKLKRQND